MNAIDPSSSPADRRFSRTLEDQLHRGRALPVALLNDELDGEASSPPVATDAGRVRQEDGLDFRTGEDR